MRATGSTTFREQPCRAGPGDDHINGGNDDADAGDGNDTCLSVEAPTNGDTTS